MAKSIGKLIEDAVQEYGIRGPLAGLAGDLDSRTVTVVGYIRDSDDAVALAYPEHPGDYRAATFVYEVPMDSTEPPEV